MSARWDHEFERHAAEQRDEDRLRYGTRRWPLTAETEVNDYEPDACLRWPEAKAVHPEGCETIDD